MQSGPVRPCRRFQGSCRPFPPAPSPGLTAGGSSASIFLHPAPLLPPPLPLPLPLLGVIHHSSVSIPAVPKPPPSKLPVTPRPCKRPCTVSTQPHGQPWVSTRLPLTAVLGNASRGPRATPSPFFLPLPSSVRFALPSLQPGTEAPPRTCQPPSVCTLPKATSGLHNSSSLTKT